VVDGLVALVAVAMAVGIVGTVVPVVPGLVLVWAAGLAYGLGAGFGPVGVAAFAVMTVLAVAGVVAGWVVPHRAAGRAGAPRLSMAVAAVCAVVGFFVVPVVGLFLGFVLGVFLAEVTRLKSSRLAWPSTWRAIKAVGFSMMIEIFAGMCILAVWVAGLFLV